MDTIKHPADQESQNSGSPELAGAQIWTVSEVSEFFQIKPETVRAMARRGEIPAFKVGRIWRFRKSDMLEITRNQAVPKKDKGESL